MSNRKVRLFIAISLDGYIAKPNDDLSFLSLVQKEGEDYGYAEFVSQVDTVIIGRKTYDWVTAQMAFPHADKQTFVITRTQKPAGHNLAFYTGDLAQLVTDLKQRQGKDIFCEGGAQVIATLINADLIDEMIISVVPILVGNGTKLFPAGGAEHNLILKGVESFDTGLVQLNYSRR